MLMNSPTSQTLTTFQPTSSTISFTVFTRPVPKTLPALLGFYLSILVRGLIGAFTLVILLLKWRASFEKSTAALQWVFGLVFEAWLVKTTETLQWRYLAPGALLTLWLVFRRGYTGNDASHPIKFTSTMIDQLTFPQKNP